MSLPSTASGLVLFIYGIYLLAEKTEIICQGSQQPDFSFVHHFSLIACVVAGQGPSAYSVFWMTPTAPKKLEGQITNVRALTSWVNRPNTDPVVLGIDL